MAEEEKILEGKTEVTPKVDAPKKDASKDVKVDAPKKEASKDVKVDAPKKEASKDVETDDAVLDSNETSKSEGYSPRGGRRDDQGARKDFKRRPREFDEPEKIWNPRTLLGKKVKIGQISSMTEIMSQSSPLKEVEIVDKLLPEMGEEVLDVGRVQRVTDSGRRMRFRVVVAVGNNDGYVGVGNAKGKEAGPTIRKAIERAKLKIVEVKRGCGSWECGCGKPHTVPYKVTGKVGSVSVTLMPAPRGVGIVSGKLAKTVLSLAGITDVWVKTEGRSRTGINFAHAVIKALEATNYMKLKSKDEKIHNIVTGTYKSPTVEEVVA